MGLAGPKSGSAKIGHTRAHKHTHTSNVSTSSEDRHPTFLGLEGASLGPNVLQRNRHDAAQASVQHILIKAFKGFLTETLAKTQKQRGFNSEDSRISGKSSCWLGIRAGGRLAPLPLTLKPLCYIPTSKKFTVSQSMHI